MANVDKGFGPSQWAYARITTDTDTVVIAAPGEGKTIYIQHIDMDVEAAQAGGLLRLEDGAGGDVVAAINTASASHNTNDFSTYDDPYGRPLTANAALNAETTSSGTPATVVVNVKYRVHNG